jgi:hypothetical protein
MEKGKRKLYFENIYKNKREPNMYKTTSLGSD